MQVDEGLLRDFLFDSGLLTRGQLADIAESLGTGSLYETILQSNMVNEDELRRAAAHATGTQFVVLIKDDFSPAALMHIPEPLARLHNILAYKLEGDVLGVVLLNLDDLVHLSPLNLPYRLEPRLTSRASIKQGLVYYQKILREKFGALMGQGAHVVDALIHHALLSSAHGIHIDIKTTALVRYRVGRTLHEAMQLPLHIGAQLSQNLKNLAKLLPTSSGVQEGGFKFEKNGERHLVRMSTLPTVGGERIVLRVARESAGAAGFSLTALGLHGEALERVHALQNAPSGLVIVAGPAQGGKTTTLYTILDQLNHQRLSVATVEERVEHRFPFIAQTTVRPEIGLSWAASLRSILKQNPDVVMVGDLHDGDTLALALHAADRGVLVFVGVEAASAGDALDALRGMGVSPDLLATNLLGVISVATVKKLCPKDKEMFKLSRAESAPLESYANFGRVLMALKEEKLLDDDKPWKDVLFARAVSCSHCEAGYKGIAGIQEVMPMTAQTKEMILGGAPGAVLEDYARETGMLTLLEDALFKAAQGVTSIEEVFDKLR